MEELVINYLLALMIGALIYLIISKICDTIFNVVKMHTIEAFGYMDSDYENCNIKKIKIDSEEDLQKLFKNLEKDFKKFEEEKDNNE